MTRPGFLALLLLNYALAVAQTQTLVSADLAESHLASHPDPVYPASALEARIQGNVILSIDIDSAGNVSSARVVTGHPMLESAAVNAVRRWKYQPFSSNGQSVPVSTWVMIRFGNPANHDAQDKAELAFQYNFNSAIRSAAAALSNDKMQATEQNLSEAKTSLASVGPPPQHLFENWRWTMLMGELNRRQKKLTEAEQRFAEAVAIQKEKKGSIEQADSLMALGTVYLEEDQLDRARESLSKASSIHQKLYHSQKDPVMRASFGRVIGDESWMLSRIALKQEKQVDALRECRTVVEFLKQVQENDPKVQQCEHMLAEPSQAAK